MRGGGSSSYLGNGSGSMGNGVSAGFGSSGSSGSAGGGGAPGPLEKLSRFSCGVSEERMGAVMNGSTARRVPAGAGGKRRSRAFLQSGELPPCPRSFDTRAHCCPAHSAESSGHNRRLRAPPRWHVACEGLQRGEFLNEDLKMTLRSLCASPVHTRSLQRAVRPRCRIKRGIRIHVEDGDDDALARSKALERSKQRQIRC